MQDDLSTYTSLTDEELILFAQNCDEAAFTELMSRYSLRIWKVIVVNSRQRRDAEEILMDVWQSVWDNIEGLRNINSFGGWVHRIAYNACKRYYTSRHHSNYEIVCSLEELTEHIERDSLARFRQSELCEFVTEAVHHLPDNVRKVAELYYLELWSVKEIHTELGLATGTIKTKLRQTRELLRIEFGVNIERGTTMSSKREEAKQIQTRIKVIGVGGAGGNAVNRMIKSELTDIEFFVVNTDKKALNKCEDATQILIGVNTTQGNGCMADPEIGKKAAEEDSDTLANIVSDTDIIFVLAGMGGGTGAGAAPKIASLAREQGALAIAVVTRPFAFEGQRVAKKAEQGLQELQEHANSVHVVSNQHLLDTLEQNRKLKISEAFGLSDQMILNSVTSILSDQMILNSATSISEFHTNTMKEGV